MKRIMIIGFSIVANSHSFTIFPNRRCAKVKLYPNANANLILTSDPCVMLLNPALSTKHYRPLNSKILWTLHSAVNTIDLWTLHYSLRTCSVRYIEMICLFCVTHYWPVNYANLLLTLELCIKYYWSLHTSLHITDPCVTYYWPRNLRVKVFFFSNRRI